VFLDLLPQYGFADKVVLPLATGGSAAHVLMLDYALRPVVHSLGARHVVQGFFLHDAHVQGVNPELHMFPSGVEMLNDVIEKFRKALVAM
jgi:FMN reductase